MPLYNVEHSYPLTVKQKTDLAERITKLHATAFTTPSIFVQVKFYQQDASAQNHFVAGQPSDKCSNRIVAFVRSSSSRTKEHFDKLAEQIEGAWYIAIGHKSDEDGEGEKNGESDKKDEGKDKKKKKDEKEIPDREREAAELLNVAFVGNLIVRELGLIIPEAGKETAWVKEYRKEFEERAEMGDERFKNMLDEIENREDLKGWRA